MIAGGGGHIPCLTIDILDLHACDLIQLDVEGFEYRILQGAVRTIEKYRPVIAAENGKKGDISTLLKGLGYEFRDQSVSDAVWVPK